MQIYLQILTQQRQQEALFQKREGPSCRIPLRSTPRQNRATGLDQQGSLCLEENRVIHRVDNAAACLQQTLDITTVEHVDSIVVIVLQQTNGGGGGGRGGDGQRLQ